MVTLKDYLKRAVGAGASDVFVVAGGPVSCKVGGTLKAASESKLLPADTERLVGELYELAGREQRHFLETGDDDFSFALPGLARFRVNAYRQRGSLACVIRVVAFEIPSWRDLSIPKDVMEVADIDGGMVLVTGVAGSGKSTTQACLIDRINQTRSVHVVTLEDPIEYLHRDKRSIISQREIAVDTEGYLTALRACLRQAPDVILLGEMRDHETIRTAMTAAETGHLVIATLHTSGAVNTIDRIIDSFPANQQSQIRIQLAAVLNTVISQQLLPKRGGGMVPAFEILKATGAVKSMVRDAKTHQLDNVIASGASDGMVSMDQSILALLDQGLVTGEVALGYATNPEAMKRKMSR